MTPPNWSLAARSLKRPYPVSVWMVLFLALIPFYIFIASFMRGRALHVPELAWDRVVPLQPAWAFVYGSLYLYVILLPLFIVQQPAQIRRTVFAYLTVWITAYACFLAWPTVASRPAKVLGDGFVLWGLRSLYDFDPPYNCFPSIHVAHSFVSAVACYRVHRGVGTAAAIAASLVGVSTLFTKQHYILDVIAGIALAAIAWAVFLRKRSGDVPEIDSRLAPVLALGTVAIVGVFVAGFWVAYLFSA